MNDHGAPVAARNEPAAIKSDANLHVEVTGSTKRFHLWQQVPAWVLGFAGDRARLLHGAARLRLGRRLVRGLDGDRAVGDRVVPVAVLDRRDGAQHAAGEAA